MSKKSGVINSLTAQINDDSIEFNLELTKEDTNYDQYVLNPPIRFVSAPLDFSLVEPNTDWIAEIINNRQSVIVNALEQDDKTELKKGLDFLLYKGIKSIAEKSKHDGYEYSDREIRLLKMASIGCGTEVNGELEWELILSEKLQIWSKKTRKSFTSLTEVLSTNFPIRIIISLKSLVIPHDDGPFFEFVATHLELLDDEEELEVEEEEVEEEESDDDEDDNEDNNNEDNNEEDMDDTELLRSIMEQQQKLQRRLEKLSKKKVSKE
jgi:hypothetical protein